MKKLFKAGAFIIACAGITLFAMQTSQQGQTIKVLTSDGQEVQIPRHLALQSSLIKGFIGDLGEGNQAIPLPNVDKASLDTIIAILKALNDYAGPTPIKRSDGKYIAQRIQPIIDQAVANQTPDAIADAAMDAEYLDLEQIANGLIRAVVSRVQAQNPQMTPDGSNTAYTKIRTASYLIPILEKQYSLVTNGNISELSIADYIAIHGMPQMLHYNAKTLSLNGGGITSLDGLDTIKNIQTVQRLDLRHNTISTIAPNAFDALTNLELLSLGHNTISSIADAFATLTNLRNLDLGHNNISTIAPNAFAGLTKLEWLSLDNNTISSIAPNAFAGLTNLRMLYLYDNTISTIAPNAFAGLTKLEQLSLRDNPISASIQQNINQFKQDQGLPPRVVVIV